ncbi:hypothetical protein T4A_5816 [Trichinella pseudospiralis]|uniref:Uncharacterized protein n=1 Tax=Trichinella pseudospiralis TaxID=6337 RepID=A0A0V1FB81_TRIPS|nr:hypothetical protein T4A_5816 [Trichinella pseudospiralis]KRY83100.1 hypothetical protein T4D_1886 [Trichinella pseudospiralis]
MDRLIQQSRDQQLKKQARGMDNNETMKTRSLSLFTQMAQFGHSIELVKLHFVPTIFFFKHIRFKHRDVSSS